MSPVYVKSLKNIVSVLKPSSLIAVLIFSVFLSGSVFAESVPDTGQTTCYRGECQIL
jgi:hypothetical protein